MTPSRRVQGWAWYAAKRWSSRPVGARHPFDGLAKPPKVRLVCPVRTSAGLRNRFPGDPTTGYLLVTERPTAPEVGEAWSVEPAELEEGFRAGAEARLLRVVMTTKGRWGEVQECVFQVGRQGLAAPVRVRPIPT